MNEERYIGQPIRSLQTMLRTISRADARLPPVIPDGIYGADTQRSVRVFQQLNGLPVTGEVDNQTWNQLVAVFSALSPSVLPAAPLQLRWRPGLVIEPGSQNTHLYLVQALLISLKRFYVNSPALSLSGIHDEASVAAVQWLQACAALPQTGAVDQRTWAHLAALYTLTAGDGEQ